MADGKNAFSTLPGDDTLARALRDRQVPLRAELLRAGAQWEETLAILKEMANHRRPFPEATEALAWYRGTHHPAP